MPLLQKKILGLFCVMFLFSCKDNTPKSSDSSTSFTIAFASCNRQEKENFLYNDILAYQPDIFIWGGDMIYPEEYTLKGLKEAYTIQKNNVSYQDFCRKVPVVGIYDDHDYGLNDGGSSNSFKLDAKNEAAHFLSIPPTDSVYTHSGLYQSYELEKNGIFVKVILLDTRYFRSDLTPSTDLSKRYQGNPWGEGSILGEEQWTWFENELQNSKAQLNIVMSSIQLLSDQHGFECWANMPHEKDKFINLIAQQKDKQVIVLSGDRHIAEISKITHPTLNYPLIDFTSSGMTHTFESAKEDNPYRISPLVTQKNFGLLQINFSPSDTLIDFEIKGDNSQTYFTYRQHYEKLP